MNKVNEIINRLNLLLNDIDEYNNKNEDKINIGVYLNYKRNNIKYNNSVYFHRNMERNKMLELMSKESDVNQFIKSFNKTGNKRKDSKDKINKNGKGSNKGMSPAKGEITKPVKNNVILMRDRR